MAVPKIVTHTATTVIVAIQSLFKDQKIRGREYRADVDAPPAFIASILRPHVNDQL